MFIGLNAEGQRVAADHATHTVTYTCPICGGELVLKRGTIKVPHFAHKYPCTDTWHYDMSEWHYAWQLNFPEEAREVVRTLNGVAHRADILLDDEKLVLEFQHSTLKAEEFEDRNRFYTSLGYKVIWVFDVAEKFSDGTISYMLAHKDDEWFRWRHASKMLRSVHPSKSKDVIICFEVFARSEDENDPCFGLIRLERAGVAKDGTADFRMFIATTDAVDLLSADGRAEVFESERDRFKSWLRDIGKYHQIEFYRGQNCPKGKLLHNLSWCKGCYNCVAIVEVRPDDFFLEEKYGIRNRDYWVYCTHPKWRKNAKTTKPRMLIF